MTYINPSPNRKHLSLVLAIVAGLAQTSEGQWTPPVIYPQSVSDTWHTRSPDGSGYNYSLSLTRNSGGLETKWWVPSAQFQQTYNTTGWYVQPYNAYAWDGGAYSWQQSQNGPWQCCLAALPWPAKQKLQIGSPGPGQFRVKTFNLEMATGGSEKAFKWVLLKANAFQYTSWYGIEPSGGNPLAPGQIDLLGRALNPDYRRFARVAANSISGATPTTTASSYGFDVWAEQHAMRTLTYSRHRLIAGGGLQASLQGIADAGSAVLGVDDDGQPGGSTIEDDYPCYLEFTIIPKSPSDQFDSLFDHDDYYWVTQPEDLEKLLGPLGQNLGAIRVVASLDIMNQHSWGAATLGGNAMVVVQGIKGPEFVHEFGHMKGLDHRGDAAAIMHHAESAGANEVNLNEGLTISN